MSGRDEKQRLCNEAEVEADSHYASGYSEDYSFGFRSGVDWLLERLEQIGWWHDEYGFEVLKHGIEGPDNSGVPVYRVTEAGEG